MADELVTWTTYSGAVSLLLRCATVRAAWKIALVVGTLLTVINEGGVIAEGEATWVTGLRVAANYSTSFLVSSAGFLAAPRR